ncbi:MAG TPA: PAS domain S-box protein, partial [Nitrospira sp.]|nr:PAS domain S-box protein [Nitrospira sp.]
MAGSFRHTTEAAAFLTAAVDSSHDAIITKNLSGIIQTWNRSAERVFGYTAEEAIGQPILLIIPPHLHAEEMSILTRLGNGEHIDHYETVRRRKDGQLIEVVVTMSPVRDEQGSILGASKIVRDITERRQATRKMAEVRNLLSLIVASSDDAIVSKDLNGIITSWNRGAER